jgi:hypothetical protein
MSNSKDFSGLDIAVGAFDPSLGISSKVAAKTRAQKDVALSALQRAQALLAQEAKNAAAAQGKTYVASLGKPPPPPKGAAPVVDVSMTVAQIDQKIADLNAQIVTITAQGGGDINQLLAQINQINDLKAQIAALQQLRASKAPAGEGAAPPVVEWKADGSGPLPTGGTPTGATPMLAHVMSSDTGVPLITYNPQEVPAETPGTALVTTTPAAPATGGFSNFVATHKPQVIAGVVGVSGALGLLWYYLKPKKV